jgi:hypothetical protein
MFPQLRHRVDCASPEITDPVAPEIDSTIINPLQRPHLMLLPLGDVPGQNRPMHIILTGEIRYRPKRMPLPGRNSSCDAVPLIVTGAG